MRRFAGILVLTAMILFGAAIGSIPDARAATLTVGLQPFATGLSQPIDLANSHTPGDGRLFVAQREGLIRIVQSNGSLAGGSFLDVSSLISTDGEGGLLGLALHPDYTDNGFFYVFYTEDDNDIVVARYTADGDPDTATTADPDSALEIITIPHPTFTNHYGGDLAFGPDGYLYISTGDGGAGDDPPNNAQNINVLLGKILRLDVDNPGGGNDYSSPAGNPFLGVAGRDEIWDYGLRNPFRMNFDRSTGDLYIGDVGQGAREEVSRHPNGTAGGLNFGWRCYEGSIPNPNTSVQCSIPNRTGPVGEYNQGGPRAVTGGTVYRGTAQPSLTGYYFFADFFTGDFYTLRNTGSGFEQIKQQTFGGRTLVTFGEDVNGEVFTADISNGTIYRVTGEPYSSQWVGQSAYPTVGGGEEATVHIDYKNLGSQNWTTGGSNPVRLATSGPNNRASKAYNSSWLSPNRPTTVTGQVNGGVLDTGDTTIEPNQVGRFQFKVVGQPTGSTAVNRERFRLVADGLTFLPDQGVFLDVTNSPRTYGSNWAGQTYPPAVLNPGQTVTGLKYNITNTGTATWRRDTPFPTRLATNRPMDRISPFANGWLSGNRLPNFAGKLEGGGSVTNQDTIAPGETAQFQYNVTAPNTPGLYQEHVRPVVDGFAHLNDQGIFWETYVKNPAAPTHDYAVAGQSAYPTLAHNGQATLKLRIRNTGTATWASNGATPVRLGTERPMDRLAGFSNNGTATGWLSANRIHLTRNLTDPAKNIAGETTVAQGEVGEFEFTIVGVPPKGTYREYVRPVIDGIGWLRDFGIYWDVTVQ